MRPAFHIALMLALAGCDVEASLGSHDAGIDALLALDAHGVDGGHDSDAAVADAASDDAGLDAAHDLDASHGADGSIDAPVLDAPATCATPDAGTCIQCQAAMCCAEYTACQAVPTCPCIVDCVFAGHLVADCETHCGADHGESTALLSCAQHHCACP